MVGAGEGAFLVTEQLGLDQLAGDRRAVHGDQRRLGPRARPVQRLDQHLLADAGFAVDQHRNVLFQHALRLADSLLHALIALVQAAQVEQRRLAGVLAEIPWLAVWFAGATHDAVEALAAQGAQQQRQFFRLIQQVQ